MRRSSVEQWFTSVKKGNSPNLERILDRRIAWNIDIRDDQLRSALFIAAELGNLDCVRKLLERGADPNRQSRTGTPAHASIESKSPEILTLLLNYGAHLDTRNRKGLTVLEHAENTFGRKKTEQILSNTDHLKFDYLRRRQRRDSSISADSDDELQIGVLAAPLPRVSSKEIKRFKDILSKGPYSFYSKGKVNREDVTVKSFNKEVNETQIKQLFAREVRALSNLRHSNILLLMSACYGPTLNEMCMVFEPVQRGFLHRILYVAKETLEEDVILEIARDIACGLVYMHERGYIHCYLGSHSVTLTEQYQAKICNFEYCQVLNNSDQTCGKPISHIQELYEYMAPAQLQGRAADKLGDVYSLGMTVWECVTRKRPLANISNFKCIMGKNNPRMRKLSGKWTMNIKNLIKDCTKPAQTRPNSIQVYDWLDGLSKVRLVNTQPANMIVEELPRLFPKMKIELSKIRQNR